MEWLVYKDIQANILSGTSKWTVVISVFKKSINKKEKIQRKKERNKKITLYYEYSTRTIIIKFSEHAIQNAVQVDSWTGN